MVYQKGGKASYRSWVLAIFIYLLMIGAGVALVTFFVNNAGWVLGTNVCTGSTVSQTVGVAWQFYHTITGTPDVSSCAARALKVQTTTIAVISSLITAFEATALVSTPVAEIRNTLRRPCKLADWIETNSHLFFSKQII